MSDPDPEKKPPPPAPTLDYYADSGLSPTATIGHFIGGMVIGTFGGIFVMMFSAVAISPSGVSPHYLVAFGIVIAIIAFASVLGTLRGRRRPFFMGLLAGFGIAALLSGLCFGALSNL